MPIATGQNANAGDFINNSEKNATPANNAGKVPKLESTGRIHENFMPGKLLASYEFTADGTFTKPDFGQLALVYVWSAGGGGGAAKDNSDSGHYGRGGAGGAFTVLLIPLYLLPSTVSCTIGVGGAGGAVTTNATAQNGSAGGNTSFGDFITLNGGPGGQADTSTGTSGSTAGISTNSSLFGFFLLQLLAGGSSGANSQGSGDTPSDAPDTTYQGAGGGIAQRNVFTDAKKATLGGSSSYLSASGGDGSSQSSAIATGGVGGVGCGGGGAYTETGASATGGDGGDGFIRVEIY